jgi:hypothetical protein
VVRRGRGNVSRLSPIIDCVNYITVNQQCNQKGKESYIANAVMLKLMTSSSCPVSEQLGVRVHVIMCSFLFMPRAC